MLVGNTVSHALRRWGLFGTVARFLLAQAETKRFRSERIGTYSKSDKKELLERFSRIHSHVECAHSPYQFILVAEHLLELKAEGAIVECGCYRGGGSAKLSVLAKMTGRKLFICDSFAGLPPNEAEDTGWGQRARNAGVPVWKEGLFSAELEEVRNNIAQYGEIDVCTFVPGFFKDSLKELHVAAACVFLDVDLISSARDCLKYLWPQTVTDGLWFTHEACYPNYIRAILDSDWWQSSLDESPPVIFGAGSGLSECATGLAYFTKAPESEEQPEYSLSEKGAVSTDSVIKR